MKRYGNLNGTWELGGYSDRDCVGDNDTQTIVIGCIVIINPLVIVWNSLSQKTVTLSVTEAGYSTITEVYCKMRFFRAISLFMGVVLEFPIAVHVDNLGAIFLL